MLRRPLPRQAAAAAAVGLLAILTGCATVIDESAGSSTTTEVVVTTVPSGPASELLESMNERVAGLSEMVVESGGQSTLDRLAEIEALWAAARPEVAANRPELVEDFDRVVELCRRAAERRRPAEADKALVILAPLIAAYETT
jgi:hypothetical protein